MQPSLSLEEVKELSKEYNLIPVFVEFMADTETPLSVYLKLKEGWRYSFLLESAEGGIKWGRYSFVVLSSGFYYAWKSGIAYLYDEGRVRLYEEKDPLKPVEELLEGFRPYSDSRLPRFWGGLVGYVGYDVVKQYEPVGDKNPDPLSFFDLFMVISEAVVVHDNLSGSLKVIVPLHVDKGLEEEYNRALALTEKIRERIFKGVVYPIHFPEVEVCLEDWRSNFTKEGFIGVVKKAKEYISQGDVVQVVLSQRFEKTFKKKPESVYRSLRYLNPSPYMYYADLGDLKVVGSSPEVLVRLEGKRIETRPIAGTRKRGLSQEEDTALELELLGDEKERAEHLMLVDLARNDVGKVSKAGSVKVEGFMRVERYSHVMHLVSDVVGEIRENLHAVDVLKALFPAGTVSGAPKVRAMQIIEELENQRRGIYAGAVGYISFDQNMDMAIAIRTAVFLGGKVYVQAGAGVVADSEPEREWQETVNKAKALMKAISMAESVEEEG
ncbi:MAG: anthranilate synthase component I [Aquificaceae bacterium]|nr:anthranilate synthase component I [Aquificaceae bacterium]